MSNRLGDVTTPEMSLTRVNLVDGENGAMLAGPGYCDDSGPLGAISPIVSVVGSRTVGPRLEPVAGTVSADTCCRSLVLVET